MTDKQREILQMIFKKMEHRRCTPADGIFIANCILFEMWRQMGARRDFIETVIGNVANPLREAMLEYLNSMN